MSDTALVVIDVQLGIFSVDGYPVYDGDGLLTRLGSLIEKAHVAGVPVIYVQHVGGSEDDDLHPSRPGHAIHPRIAPQAGDIIVKKTHPDAFQDTTLKAELDKLGVKHLIIGGMETPMCVDTSTRSAYRQGYQVTLIADGHSAPSFYPLPGETMVKYHNMVLGSNFCKVEPAAEIAFAPQQVIAEGGKSSSE